MRKTIVCAFAMGASVIGATGWTAMATPLTPGTTPSVGPAVEFIQVRPGDRRAEPIGLQFHPRPVPRPRVIHRTVQPRQAVAVKRPAPLCRCR